MREEIQREWAVVKDKYPNLGDLSFLDGSGKSSGSIEIKDQSGIVWDTFDVNIEIPELYPNVAPIIYEIGGKIPKEGDWHVNYDGSCCVGPNTKIYRKLDNNMSIIRWIDIVVMPYFLDQIHRIETGKYAGKEHEHGSSGLLEDYMEWWNLDEIKEVLSRLRFITGKCKYSRNLKCFCGSGAKFKKCHLNKTEYENIPLEVYKTDLRMIEYELSRK